MKKILVSLAVSLLFSLSAFAQDTGGGPGLVSEVTPPAAETVVTAETPASPSQPAPAAAEGETAIKREDEIQVAESDSAPANRPTTAEDFVAQSPNDALNVHGELTQALTAAGLLNSPAPEAPAGTGDTGHPAHDVLHEIARWLTNRGHAAESEVFLLLNKAHALL